MIIELKNISDINHTRIIKWLFYNHITQYEIKKTGSKDYTIDVSKLIPHHIDNLKNYLNSQNY
jgi:hypothetical protein